MGRWRFYLPFAYFMGSRVVSRAARLSFVLIYFVPLLLVLLSFGGASFDAALRLLIATICTYAIYELGYLENDTVTVRTEQAPTLRLNELQQSYVSDYWLVILLVRLVLVAVLLGFLSEAPGFVYYLLSLVCLMGVFPLYNRRRGKINAALQPILVTARFCGPLLLVLPDMTVLLYGFILFPLINGLERAREPRYQIDIMQKVWFADGDSGRWGYYLVMLVVWLVVCLVTALPAITLLPLAYMFVYRLTSPWLMRLVAL